MLSQQDKTVTSILYQPMHLGPLMSLLMFMIMRRNGREKNIKNPNPFPLKPGVIGHSTSLLFPGPVLSYCFALNKDSVMLAFLHLFPDF